MNKDDIIRMAREAGIKYSKNLNQIVSPYCDGVHMDELEKFINLVAAAEREACAKVCDSYDVADDVCSSDTAEGIAIAIRARVQ
jgi:hypothetical protein